MIYFCSLLSDVGDAIIHAFRILGARIAALIYNGIVWAYDLFTYIARAEILDNDFVNEIYRKVGLILALFMTFKLTFSLIQSLVDPSKFTDKKSGFGQIISRCIISIVLLGITPTIFKEAFAIQNLIIGSKNSDNVIYKLIVGKPVSNKASSFGKIIATEVYFSFYQDEKFPYMTSSTIDPEDGYADFEQDNIEAIKEAIVIPDANGETQDFNYAIKFLGQKINNDYVIEFDELYCIIVGAIVFWLLIMYCIQTSIRVFQLAYLQLIAPVPLLSYISDPDGAFKKWLKQCTTTFLDLFIRLAIIYFAVSLLDEVLNQLNNADSILKLSLGGLDNGTIAIIKIFLILGLLLFAKRVPELLKDLFPNMGGGAAGLSFGLNPKKELLDPIKSTMPAKAIGFMGKKGIGFVDRKIHNLPKQRNKVQQWFDKMAPGHAEVVKQKNQAKLDEKERRKNEEYGEKLYYRYGKDLPSSAFSSPKYRESYEDLEEANRKNKTAEKEYQTEYARYTAAYNSGDQKAIENAEKRLETAARNKKTAEGMLELAKTRHEANKKIYAKDARKETQHSYYKKTHGKREDYKEAYIPPQRQTQMPNPPSPQPVNPPAPQSQQSSIIIEQHAPSSRREEPPEVQRQRANSEHESLIQQYNNAPKGSKEREELGRKIEEFERKH